MILHVCTRCGATYEDRALESTWRWTGERYEHACLDASPQTEHFAARGTTLGALLADAEARGRAAADAEWLAAVRAERSVVRVWCEAAGCRRLATLRDDRGGPSYCYCDDHATEGGEEMVERMADVGPLAALVDRALAAEGGR